MIEVEKKYKEIFINYKNKNDFTNTRYTTDFLFGNLTKEEYDKKQNEAKELLKGLK
jgi:hypothetical protein